MTIIKQTCAHTQFTSRLTHLYRCMCDHQASVSPVTSPITPFCQPQCQRGETGSQSINCKHSAKVFAGPIKLESLEKYLLPTRGRGDTLRYWTLTKHGRQEPLNMYERRELCCLFGTSGRSWWTWTEGQQRRQRWTCKSFIFFLYNFP